MFGSFISFFITFGAANANADDFTPYISLGGGQILTKFSESGPGGGLDMNKATWGSLLKVGMDYKQYLGVELHTGISGKIDHDYPVGTIGSAVPLNVSAQVNHFIAYFGKAQYPVSRKIKAYGLLGATTARFSVRRNQGANGTLDAWKTDLSFGLGVEYKFHSKGSIGLEWVQYWSNAPMDAIAPSTSSKASFSGASLVITRFF